MKTGWIVFGVLVLVVALSATSIASYHLCLGPVCVFSDPVDDSPLQLKLERDTPNPLYIERPDRTVTLGRVPTPPVT